MNIRSALTAPFRLSFVDLLAALAIAVLAFGLIIGPVLGQEASPSAEPTMAAEATPQAKRSLISFGSVLSTKSMGVS